MLGHASSNLKFHMRRIVSVSFCAIILSTGCGGPSATSNPTSPGPPLTPSGIIAAAGYDFEVLEGSQVKLDGSGSRVQDATLEYQWTQTSGPEVILSNPSSVTPLFRAPLGPVSLQFKLRVSDGTTSNEDEITVHVTSELRNEPLLIQSGPDLVGNPGQNASLWFDTVENTTADMTWQASTTCATELELDEETRAVHFVTPYQLPCAVFIEAVTPSGLASNRAGSMIWPEDTFIPAATNLIAPNIVEPEETFDVKFSSSYTGRETPVFWQQGSRYSEFQALTDIDTISLTAPSYPGRYILAADFRARGTSGGMTFFHITVTEGENNHAPVFLNLPERAIRIGGSFRLTADVIDIDQDEVMTEFVQVYGNTASSDPTSTDTFTAPQEEGVLLFHAFASDGTVNAVPQPVRVSVDSANNNHPPVLETATELYVAPQSLFSLDGRGAEDPDSGIVQDFLISQATSDEEILLETPVEADHIELTSGDDGQTYNFFISFADELGASTTVPITVYVEDAGPYVDPDRAPSETANGTIEKPFPDLESALPFAVRHQMTELKLTSGPHIPFSGILPDGLWVKGGHSFDGDAYSANDTLSSLAIADTGLELTSGGLESMHLILSSATSEILLAGESALVNTTIEEDTRSVNAAIRVAGNGNVGFDRVEAIFSNAATGDLTAVKIDEGGFLRITDSEIDGGSWDKHTLVDCQGGILDIIGSTLIGANNATDSTAIVATNCDLQVYNSAISGGGASDTSAGIIGFETSLYLDSTSTVLGASTTNPLIATGLELDNTVQASFIAGTVLSSTPGTTATTARAVVLKNGPLDVEEVQLDAYGTESAIGIEILNGHITLTDVIMSLEATQECVGVLIEAAQSFQLSGATITASGQHVTGIELSSTASLQSPSLTQVDIDIDSSGVGSGIIMNAAADTTIEEVTIEIQANSQPELTSRGISMGSGLVTQTSIAIDSTGSADGIRVATHNGQTTVEKSHVWVNSTVDAGMGFLAGGPSLVTSSIIDASGATTSTGVEVRSEFQGLHVTIFSGSLGVYAITDASDFQIVNSIINSPTALFYEATQEQGLIESVAFDSDVLLQTAEETIERSPIAFSSWECEGCLLFDAETELSDTYYIQSENSVLVDSVVNQVDVEDDIDGESRLYGPASDLGADEWHPSESE